MKEQVVIQFSVEDAELFRAWQREQKANLAARQAAQRAPWEQDPDAWKDQNNGAI